MCILVLGEYTKRLRVGGKARINRENNSQEIHNLYFSLNIVRMNKQKGLRCMGYATHM
jgi:hypothetical protein